VNIRANENTMAQ